MTLCATDPGEVLGWFVFPVGDDTSIDDGVVVSAVAGLAAAEPVITEVVAVDVA